MSAIRHATRAALALLFALALPTSAPGAAAPGGVRSVPKPGNETHGEPRFARSQPTVPDGCREIPFEETAPAPALTPEEQSRGFLLFHRPITEPIHPNTRPLPHERLRSLTAFAAPGEFEPLTFAIYPVRGLKNLRVRVSPLRSAEGEIPASALDLRLLTYWNIGFPRYTSRETYRRLPELLERVTAHSSPARECQRWWITAHVPENARPGIYRGAVTVWDDVSPAAVQIPVALRVLDFPLRADPAKRHSVYYEYRNRTFFAGRNETFIRRALDNEFQSMADHGLDMIPTLYLRYDRKRKKIEVRGIEDLERMRAAGLRGPVPVLGGNVISAIYSDTTPGGKRAPHWNIDKMPPPEFFKQVSRAFKRLEQERRAKHWPEFICCPLDEVAASRSEFGAKVYQTVRDTGMRTYATKNPLSADAPPYRPALDIWCSQPFAVPYEKIIAQKRFEYWSYPNHNAGEIKDRRVMCKGGRMTYGFGFWRSGYTTLIPWHWAWTPGDDAFDYLRGRQSGCGQRIDDEARVIPAVYWECFREGRDDARYIYTLQQSAWERANSAAPKCLALVKSAMSLLRENWGDITVQKKYLAENMWPSGEFNARRWEMARMIAALRKFPPARTGAAPSVFLAAATQKPPARPDESRFLDAAIARGELETLDLAGDFSQWKNATPEGSVSISPDAGRAGRPGLRWRVKVDHRHGQSPGYPIGWPRLSRTFPNGVDMTLYDYLLFRVRIDSNRDEVADDTTPVGFTLGSNKFYEVARDLGGQQHVWLSVLFPVRSLIDSVGRGAEPWKAVPRFQMFIAEKNYSDGTELTFDVAEVQLLRFKHPTLRKLAAPRRIMLPRPLLVVPFETMGEISVGKGTHTVEASITDGHGKRLASSRRDLAADTPLVIDTSRLRPGAHRLIVTIHTRDGTLCSRLGQPLHCIPGPVGE
jgi:hypothetical protein